MGWLIQVGIANDETNRPAGPHVDAEDVVVALETESALLPGCCPAFG